MYELYVVFPDYIDTKLITNFYYINNFKIYYKKGALINFNFYNTQLQKNLLIFQKINKFNIKFKSNYRDLIFIIQHYNFEGEVLEKYMLSEIHITSIIKKSYYYQFRAKSFLADYTNSIKFKSNYRCFYNIQVYFVVYY
jgi:hypothetical protein